MRSPTPAQVPVPQADAGWLNELVLHLHQIQSAVVVSAAALRLQNCEMDDDIANVLQRSVADRIQDQIERAEGILQKVGDPTSA